MGIVIPLITRAAAEAYAPFAFLELGFVPTVLLFL